MRVLESENCPPLDALVAEHVALPTPRPSGGTLVRLNMIASADGGSALAGRSGGLGNDTDHAVFGALRAAADAIVVGMRTVIAEKYGPVAEGQRLYVIATRPDVSGNPDVFASGRATLVLPQDAADAPAGVDVLRVGTGHDIDLRALVDTLAGQVVMAEGGPTIAGQFATLGLIDEFFLTVAPRVIAGDVGRVAHGADADPARWKLRHGFADDDGLLFLRYARRDA